MNTKVRGIITRSTITSFWAVALSLITIIIAPYAMADTAANTQINNHVTVYYSSENDSGSYMAEADVTVTVSLVAAAPTIDYPTDINSTESTNETLIYTITGNANGLDNYDFSIFDFSSTGLTGGSYTITGGGTIPIGGTTLAEDATTTGQLTITVPYDGTLDVIANGIEAGDTIIIGGETYQVATTGTPIAEDATTNLTTITLQSGISGAGGLAGELVREQVRVDVVVTTGALSGMSGNHGVAARVTWGGSTNIDQTPSTVITVGRPSLTVDKYVRDTNPSALPGTGTQYTFGSTVYYSSVNAPSTATLEYIIVVANPDVTSGGSTANNVVIEDSIPQFTSYVAESMILDPDGDGSGLVTIADASSDNDPGEYDSGSNRVFIYVGTGGTDTGMGPGTYGGGGDGTGGTLPPGTTAVGRFQVTID